MIITNFDYALFILLDAVLGLGIGFLIGYIEEIVERRDDGIKD